MNEENDKGWAAFFGVIATSIIGVALLLAVGVGILVGYYAIGSGGNSSSPTTMVAKSTSGSGSSSMPMGSSSAGTTTAALVSAGDGLKAPAGVTVREWASGLPDISDLTYDSKGRVWATATSDPLAKVPVPPPGNGVYLLEAGKKPLKVISTVKQPIGLAWYHEELIVSNYGHIDEYTGFNGHSFAHHTILINHIGAGESGWSDNPAVGPEGRIYVENGAGCDACVPHGYLEADTISFNPNGSDIKVFAKGIRGNSFSEFMPGTSDLFQVMNQQNALVPAPDDQLGIIHEGDNWGFPTCYGQGGAVCNGIATAIAYLPQHNGSNSLALVDGQLGAAYGTSAFITSFTGAGGSVERVALTKTGSTYKASGTPYEFLTGLKDTDGILLTPKGSLLVGDYGTGKIYEVSVNQSTQPGASATVAIKVPATVTGKLPATTPASSKASSKTESSSKSSASTPASSGSAPTTAKLEASPQGELMYVQKTLTLAAGASTLEFVNNSPLGHDVVVEQNGKKFGETPVIEHTTAKLKLNLKPGKYTYYCSVPGHRMAGMEGTLTVQ